MLARVPMLRVLGFGSYFAFAFCLFAYWSFPYERAVEHYVAKLTADSGTRITVGDVDPYWFTGVEVEDVKVYTATDDGTGLRIKEGHARASLMTALGNEVAVTFHVELPTGSLEGEFLKDEEVLALDANLDNIHLEMFPMLKSVTAGLPLAGAATGVIDLVLNDQPDKSEGKVDLKIEGMRIGDGDAKLSIPGVPALTVDPVMAGDLELAMQIGDGRAVIETFEANGKDLELSGEGEIKLGKSIGTSRPRIYLKARFTDAYKKKTPRTEAMFSLLEGSNAPMLKRATTPDGSYAFQLTGSLASPRFVPGAGGAGGAGRRKRGGRRSR